MFRGGSPLNPAAVAQSGRADDTVAPGLRRDPFNEVVRVLRVVHVRFPYTFRFASSANVRRHEAVPVLAPELAISYLSLLAVRRCRHHDRHRPIRGLHG